MKKPSPRALAVLATLLTLALLGLYLWAGPVLLDLGALLDPDSEARSLLGLRLPRALLALLVGGSLAVAGTAFQALLQNPLADPFILGVSGGAAFGAALGAAAAASFLGLSPVLAQVPVFALAFAGALAASALVFLSAGAGNTSRMLLAWVVTNFLASSLIVILNTVLRPEQAQDLIYRLSGSLAAPPPAAVLWPAVVICVLGFLWLLRLAPGLDALSLGPRFAHDLGHRVETLNLAIFLPATLMTAVVVSLSGFVGFVGLIVPHALRSLLGPAHHRLLPASFLAGGAFLLACDLLARLSFPVFGTQAPVGALTALVGAPVFFVLLHRLGGGHERS